ncbi:MAG: 50S ribosomal protein L31 [Planctomycetota bacterium]|jgi:large subunit ribosomal protein L31|nr:50S ribosomal protein L31 [Planctomycetota bacterium]
MKAEIHPHYEEVTVHCACGNEFKTRSTKKEIRLALCNECHPFFTGKQKFVDTAGRIEKFQKRFNLAEGATTAALLPPKKKVSKKQTQSAAIQEEKRQKAARRLPRRAESPAESAEKATPAAKAAKGGDSSKTE